MQISGKYLAAGFTAGLLCLFIPLLRNFHWESAALAGIIIAIVSGYWAAKGSKSPLSIFKKVLFLLVPWAFPLFISDLITGCYTIHGLGFWILIPLPSALFGLALGRLMLQMQLKYPVLITILILMVISAAPVLVIFLHNPQLFFFNHIWGYWPGPIYDEAVHLPGRLLLFRSATICWIFILWFIPTVMSS